MMVAHDSIASWPRQAWISECLGTQQLPYLEIESWKVN